MQFYIKNAWIFSHPTAVEKIKSTANDFQLSQRAEFQKYFWDATDAFPKTTVCLELNPNKDWLEVYTIETEDIAFQSWTKDSDEIFFLKMAE